MRCASRSKKASGFPVALCLLGAAALLGACQSSEEGMIGAPMAAGRGIAASRMQELAPAPASDRSIIRTGWLKVEVEDVPAATTRLEAIVEAAKGYVESSQSNEERTATIRFRVPAESLDMVLDQTAALGEELSRTVSANDVTEEVADLEAALANKRALRDRLRKLLDSATKVEDILKIEMELGRLQTDVDQMEGRLQRLRSQVALSSVTVELVRKRVLGPLGYLGQGLAWLFEKAVVIRD